MKKKAFLTVFLVGILALIWFNFVSSAPIEKKLYYTKKTSLAYPKTYVFKFSLWDTDIGGELPVWEEEKPLKITSATIKTYLGDLEPLDGVDFSQQLWIQVERKKPDGTYVVIGVRDRFQVVPYAMWSETPTGAQGPTGPQGEQGIQGIQGPQGDVGPAGADGKTVLNGISDPEPETGVNGDFYLNTATNFIFGPKTGGVWTAGVSLVGPQGPKGDTGDTGAQGPQGIQGHEGPLGPEGPAGVPTGFCILGETSTAPDGYTYTGQSMTVGEARSEAWTTKASMPTARENAAAGVVNNKIYVIGGWPAPEYSTINEEFDPATNTWTTKASMSVGRKALNAAVVNGKIYAIGGYDGSKLSTNEEYDPVTNTWAMKASMPTPRWGLGLAVVNSKIYAIGDGGINEQYDPATDTWSTKASMPTGRYYVGVASVNNKIYAIGGAGPLANNEEYDPATDTWSTKTSMPIANDAFGVAVVSRKIYAIGGSADTNANYEYTPATDTWTARTDMPTGRWCFPAAVVNNKIYAIGGWGPGALAANEEYDPGSSEQVFYVHRKN